MSKDQFYEKLKDPDMAAIRETAVAIVGNPKYTISKITYEELSIASGQIKMIIEVVMPGE